MAQSLSSLLPSLLWALSAPERTMCSCLRKLRSLSAPTSRPLIRQKRLLIWFFSMTVRDTPSSSSASSLLSPPRSLLVQLVMLVLGPRPHHSCSASPPTTTNSAPGAPPLGGVGPKGTGKKGKLSKGGPPPSPEGCDKGASGAPKEQEERDDDD